MPVPEDADSPRFKTNMGSVEYAPERNAFIWTIRQFPGGKDFLCRAHFGLPSVKNGNLVIIQRILTSGLQYLSSLKFLILRYLGFKCDT